MSTIGNLPHCSHRYLLFVSYLGHRYNGSQLQVNRKTTGIRNTIQEALEWSLEACFGEGKCRLTSSSRTDKGVHALMNTYTAPSIDIPIKTNRVMRLANKRLASERHEIVVKDVMLVRPEFHPRKDAVSRDYIYKLAVLNNPKLIRCDKNLRSTKMLHLLPVTDLYKVLPIPCFNCDKALAAIDLLKGEHDFTSFCAENREDSIRNLEISLSEVEPIECSKPNFSYYQLHFKSKSFLYNQVRRLVGTIISYATYERVVLDDIKYLLDNPSRLNWKKNLVAEPWGLYLASVNYDRSAFDGAIRTYSDGKEEKVIDSSSTDASDDHIQIEQKLLTSG